MMIVLFDAHVYAVCF